jgi:hypothetical protein
MTQITDKQSTSRPVKVGLVGFGWWGKTIFKEVQKSQNFQLIGIAETSDLTRSAMHSDSDLEGVTIHDNFQDLLRQAELEVVILCSPHEFHAQQILLAAKANKHVFCEKPLCLSLSDARLAIDACSSRNLILGIGHERRFEPEVMALKKMIKSGELGTILQIEANFSQNKFFALPKDNWRLSNLHAPVGPLTATGIHLVDLSISILGPCETVWARLSTLGSDFENGDTLGIMMGFANGSNALIGAVLATPFDGRLAVYGSKGWVEIRDRSHPENPTGWDVTIALMGQPVKKHFTEPAPAVMTNLDSFAFAVRSISPYPVSHTEMLANVAALEAIMASVSQNTLVKVALP